MCQRLFTISFYIELNKASMLVQIYKSIQNKTTIFKLIVKGMELRAVCE